ncbi:MAG: hydroxysqualene dehydroxylase HpnE [Acidobacteriota bacterium]
MTRALVIGGGLAGLSAATALTEAGVPCTVLEGRGSLGGRASSVVHRRTGDEIDTGQHVVMGCYDETFRYLRRIGAEDGIRLQDRLRVALVEPGRRRAVLACPPLPAPLHLAAGLFGHALLTPLERLRCVKVTMAARFGAGDPALDRISVADWLRQLGQSENALRVFWTPTCLATLNADIETAAASLFATVLDRAFLGPGQSSSLGWPTAGLSTVLAEPAREPLERGGSTLEMNQPVRGLLVENGRCVGVVDRGGRERRADVVIAAVPADVLARLLPEEWLGRSPFDGLDCFEPSSIVSVHLWLEQRVLEASFVGLIDSPVHWVFDRESCWGRPPQGGAQLLTIVRSGAGEWAERDRDEVLRECRDELFRAFPDIASTRILDSEVIKERRATFVGRPGLSVRRFGPDTPVPGLLVAGDWTDTGLPATIEGACQSGHAAAARLLQLTRTSHESPAA